MITSRVQTVRELVLASIHENVGVCVCTDNERNVDGDDALGQKKQLARNYP